MNWKHWHIPLSRSALPVEEALRSLASVGADAQEIPLIIRLVENPRYHVPGIEIFHGAVDLDTHDLIHILLGRGLLPKDEAFTIGFTMGSTKRVNALEEQLFAFIAKAFYPKPYRFADEELRVFRDAVRLAEISNCRPLTDLDRAALLKLSVGEAREALGIEEDLLRAYYRIEAARFPGAVESRRLLEGSPAGP